MKMSDYIGRTVIVAEATADPLAQNAFLGMTFTVTDIWRGHLIGVHDDGRPIRIERNSCKLFSEDPYDPQQDDREVSPDGDGVAMEETHMLNGHQEEYNGQPDPNRRDGPKYAPGPRFPASALQPEEQQRMPSGGIPKSQPIPQHQPAPAPVMQVMAEPPMKATPREPMALVRLRALQDQNLMAVVQLVVTSLTSLGVDRGVSFERMLDQFHGLLTMLTSDSFGSLPAMPAPAADLRQLAELLIRQDAA